MPRLFTKGHKIKSPGRPPVPAAVKEAKKLTAALFQETVNKLAAMTQEELKTHLMSGKATILEMGIAGQWKAIMKGQSSPLGLLLDRSIGPIVRDVSPSDMTIKVIVEDYKKEPSGS